MSAPRVVCTLAMMLAGCDAPVDVFADGLFVLPPVLREVSGIVAIDDHMLACVQDEVGAIFFVDLRGGAVRVARFGPDADYEGIAWTGAEFWILRSDGLLLRLLARGNAFVITETHRLPKDCEYEGLCYDPANERLLVAPKGPISSKKKERDRRRVFAFDLRADQLVQKPVMTIRRDDLIEQARERALVLPTTTTSKGKVKTALELRGCELAVVPGTGELLLLSASDHVLLRVDAEGRLLGARLLDTVVLPQPEAMTILPDGRLVVASEGQNGPAVVALIEYR